MKNILKHGVMWCILMFSAMALSISTFGEVTGTEVFYKKQAVQDLTIKNTGLVYSQQVNQLNTLEDNKITDMEIITEGGIGTRLIIETYNANAQLINSYSTIIKCANEYNYVKTTTIFNNDCTKYIVRTNEDCIVGKINFYNNPVVSNISGNIEYFSDDLSNIILQVDGKESYTVDEKKNFSFWVDPAMTHTLKVSASGYIPVTYYNIKSDATKLTYLNRIRLISKDKSINKENVGSIKGEIMDVSTGEYSSNVKINIREGINNKYGKIIQTVISNSEGEFDTGMLDFGYYTGEVVGSKDIITTYFSFIVETDKNNIGVIGITPSLEDDKMRIILQGQSEDLCNFDGHIISVVDKEYSYIYNWDQTRCVEFIFGELGYCEREKNNTTWHTLTQGISYDLQDIASGIDSFTIDFNELANNSFEGNEVIYDYYVHLNHGICVWEMPCVYVYKGNKLINQYFAPNLMLDSPYRYWKVFSFPEYERKSYVRQIGHIYEQTVDIDGTTLIPSIISVKTELIDEATNAYRLTIEDYKCDSNGKPFFYWQADEAMFTNANEDFTTVECIIDKEVSGRNIPIKAYIGDGLGHAVGYTVWIKAN